MFRGTDKQRKDGGREEDVSPRACVSYRGEGERRRIVGKRMFPRTVTVSSSGIVGNEAEVNGTRLAMSPYDKTLPERKTFTSVGKSRMCVT